MPRKALDLDPVSMQVRLKRPVAKVVRKIARAHGVPLGELFRRLLEPTSDADHLRRVIADAAYRDGQIMTCFDPTHPEIEPPGTRRRGVKGVNHKEPKP